MKKSLIVIVIIFIGIKSTAQVSNKNPLIDSVFNYICESKILHAEIVIKQAVLETGWFKSKFLMKKNNIFAFRKKEYLTFKSWKDCVDYYKTWQKKHQMQTNTSPHHITTIKNPQRVPGSMANRSNNHGQAPEDA